MNEQFVLPVGDCPTCGRPMGDLDDAGTTASRPQATSRAPGRIRRGSDRWRCMRALLSVGPLTADGVSKLVGKTPNQTATRLQELRSGGYVQYVRDEAGKKVRRETSTGSLAYVQELTEIGRTVASGVREES